MAYVWMLMGSVAFSVMASLAHGLKHELDWQIIALTRASIPSVVLLLYSLIKRRKLVFWGTPILWMRSIAGSLSLLSVFYSLTRLPTSDVMTLTNLFPIWVALLSWPFLGERPGREAWCAVFCAIVGVVLIQQPHLEEGNFAVFVALFASFTTAVAMLGLNRLKGIDSRAIVFHFSTVAVLVCFGTWWMWGETSLHPTNLLWDVLMLGGVGLSALTGQFCLTNAFKTGPATQVSVVGLSQVGFSMLIDIFVWNRSFSWMTLLGMIFVLGPTGWLLWKVGTGKRTEVVVPVSGIDPD